MPGADPAGTGSATDAPPGTPRYSVVVPVWNEARNIGAYLRLARDHFPPGGEILLVHDSPDDDTLPAVAALPEAERPERLRLVHNTLAPGVRYAIEAGFRAARGPVVVVSMADLSDDPSTCARLVEAVEAGAAVVSASRYMPGGAQLGGPRLKGWLSRLAGWSLHLLTGLPTVDPTNSHRGYAADFLAATRIESTEGFSLSLELTVKAFADGRKVSEVPSVWRDRTSGESRFRLLRWIPHYLRWYGWALARGRPG